MNRLYYIVFETKKSQCWRIISRKYDLDTENGISKEVELLEKEFGSDVILLNWKRLKSSWCQIIKEIIGDWVE